jgi:hypothetical protein
MRAPGLLKWVLLCHPCVCHATQELGQVWLPLLMRTSACLVTLVLGHLLSEPRR